MNEKRLGGIALTIILIGVGVWLRMSRRSDDSVNIKTDITQVVSMMEGYDQNKKLIDTMTDTAHRSAFNAAYSVGGRRSPVRFDEDKYLDAFWRSMIQQADMMGRSDLKKAILDLKASVESEGTETPATDPPASSADLQSEDPSPGGDEKPPAPQNDSDPPPPDSAESKTNENPQHRITIADIPDDKLEWKLTELIQKRVNASGAGEQKAVKALTPGERMLYVTWQVEAEVNNGGFEQYFDNSRGLFAKEAILTFKLIGAKKHAVLMRRAIAAYVRENPKQKRIKVDKAVKGYLKKYKDADLGKVDDAFYGIKENLSELRIKYIRAHPGEFGQE